MEDLQSTHRPRQDETKSLSGKTHRPDGPS